MRLFRGRVTLYKGITWWEGDDTLIPSVPEHSVSLQTEESVFWLGWLTGMVGYHRIIELQSHSSYGQITHMVGGHLIFLIEPIHVEWWDGIYLKKVKILFPQSIYLLPHLARGYCHFLLLSNLSPGLNHNKCKVLTICKYILSCKSFQSRENVDSG